MAHPPLGLSSCSVTRRILIMLPALLTACVRSFSPQTRAAVWLGHPKLRGEPR